MITQQYYSCGWQIYSAQIDVSHSTLRYSASSAFLYRLWIGSFHRFWCERATTFTQTQPSGLQRQHVNRLNAENNWWGFDWPRAVRHGQRHQLPHLYLRHAAGHLLRLWHVRGRGAVAPEIAYAAIWQTTTATACRTTGKSKAMTRTEMARLT